VKVKFSFLLLCVCALLGKTLPEMICTVSGKTLNSTHSLTQFLDVIFVSHWVFCHFVAAVNVHGVTILTISLLIRNINQRMLNE